jgi:hypothetical protein
MARMPRTTVKAIHRKVPRIHDNLIVPTYSAKTAGVVGLKQPSPFHSAAFLNLAQRAFCAAAIFARPSALNARRLLGLASNSAGLKLIALLLPDVAARRPGLR